MAITWHKGLPPKGSKFFLYVDDYGITQGTYDLAGGLCYLYGFSWAPIKSHEYLWAEYRPFYETLENLEK